MKKLIVGLSMASLLGCAAQQQSAAPSPAREPVATVQPAAQAERTEKQVIAAVDTDYSVLFVRNSASLDEAATTLLRQHAERLKANPRQQVILAGFSDSVGSRAYSLALADKRVTVVMARLQELGVARKQMRRAVAGMEQNSQSCQSEECMRLMRRVEIRYVNPR